LKSLYYDARSEKHRILRLIIIIIIIIIITLHSSVTEKPQNYTDLERELIGI